jgi:hypothetical protein
VIAGSADCQRGGRRDRWGGFLPAGDHGMNIPGELAMARRLIAQDPLLFSCKTE